MTRSTIPLSRYLSFPLEEGEPGLAGGGQAATLKVMLRVNNSAIPT